MRLREPRQVFSGGVAAAHVVTVRASGCRYGIRDTTKAIDLLGRLDDENVLAAVAGIAVAGNRVSRAARGPGPVRLRPLPGVSREPAPGRLERAGGGWRSRGRDFA